VIGDSGRHERVGGDGRELVAAVTEHFRDEWPHDRSIHAIGELGARLARDLPRRPGDDNEPTTR